MAALLALFAGCAAPGPTNAQEFFGSTDKFVLTFVGYSGAGYEEPDAMLRTARGFLETHDPAHTLVNIGATPEGIGAIYALAKSMGFTTTGIVSTQARKYDARVSEHVDHAFFIDDATWGGWNPDAGALNPTSALIVDVSDELIGIGGGAIARDELLAAQRRGTPVTFVPADQNHARARAEDRGLPVPLDFRGEAHAALADQSR